MKAYLGFLLVWLLSVNGFGQPSAPVPTAPVQATTSGRPTHSFSLGDSSFLLDGKPFLMISGEIHYARVPREAWRQRMRMARAMGLNTIGTYVFWNLQEPEKGKFDFSGNNDIAEFVRTAAEEGLWVVLRPSPYVCAEWEFGGYPYWLQNEKGLVVRSTNATYLQDYKEYIDEVGKRLAPLQVNHGGNILMVQVENEYGSYSNDSNYLAINKKIFREAGFDGLLYTCDPIKDVAKGHLPGLLPAVNGLVDPTRIRSTVNRYNNGKGPYFVAEWYPAWFDWWGEPHHTVPADKYTGQLETLLTGGVSVNMYMFHGGTTRGFMNGANFYDTAYFQPEISSYDYDAPLDEAGNPTAKYMAFRKVIAAHLPAGDHLPDIPPARPAISIPAIIFDRQSAVFDLLPQPVVNEQPLTFEQLHQAYGYVDYRTTLEGKGKGLLFIGGLRDYAIVFVNGKQIGVADRRLKQDSVLLNLPGGKARLDILVENLGRVNFGPSLLKNTKGITGKVEYAGKELKGWRMYSLPFSEAPVIKAGAATAAAPVLRSASFTLDRVGDTWLDMSQWGKGVVWVNGHNLGRYWRVGPQQTLYIPAEWLKQGKNDIVVFEMLATGQHTLQAIDHPILNELQ
ncbi:glycoside hydrolase family 35 protein [Puia dinghuensis]|nr:beta-galactosidase family protein [Puia dinghuensis]